MLKKTQNKSKGISEGEKVNHRAFPTHQDTKSAQVDLKQMIDLFYKNYSSSNLNNTNHELEVKFATKGGKHLTKIDYDNVVKKIKSSGFTSENESGVYLLRINNEYLDSSVGKYKLSNALRTEINGFHSIQNYCRSNDIKLLIKNNFNSVEFVEKASVKLSKEDVNSFYLKDVYFSDFYFSVSYKTEKNLGIVDRRVQSLLNDWTKFKKTFRYINRSTFTHKEYPINVDISIVKSSSKESNGSLKKSFDFSDAGLFNNLEIYEIEIEVDNTKIGIGTEYNTPEKVELILKKTIKIILSGLQGTNYPISYSEQNSVAKAYLKLLYVEQKEKYNPDKKIYASDFIGPSSYTLQMNNIVPLNENSKNPNIRKDYVVTEKTDGARHLMYISETGKIFLINTNMNIVFTGAITTQEEYINSILDGEYVLHDKYGQFINLYMAFDLYYLNGKDVRHYEFIDEQQVKSRYSYLKQLVKGLNHKSIVEEDKQSPLRIDCKSFYPIENKINNIFGACQFILNKINSGLFDYETDGLIFTHTLYGVGSDKVGKAGPLMKITWDYSFKWKPAQFNTIDFLVNTLKGTNGHDIVVPIFENGTNINSASQLNEYKTLVLQVGFDEKKHGYINPCQDVLEDKLPEYGNVDDEDKYKKQRFYPTKPFDANAGLCNIILSSDANGIMQMKTENDEVFEDNTIVEFRYDFNREKKWNWVPLRVRPDKTSELKQSFLGLGKPNYGNSFHVADSNWKSIHYPITEIMISTGQDIPNEEIDGDVYYNRDIIKDKEQRNNNKGLTQGLRDFHNLYVKKLLIMCVSKRGEILIDYACGKGGDFSKWISAQLSFVFGIDVSKDNLENRLDGACARFLNYRKMFKQIPYALFVNGNSSLNIKNGNAMLNEKAIQITKAVFGEETSTNPIVKQLGKGVERQYGRAKAGFNISSCQFAIHYFMENINTMKNFITNVAECTALNGYFIGTSYDGKLVYELLKDKKKGESIVINDNGVKIWELRKEYDTYAIINDDSSCLGYQIDVFQESINKMIPEYLVNYDYLNQVMEDYGFVLLKNEEAINLGLPASTGLFSTLFSFMEEEIKKNKFKKNDYGKAYMMNAFEKKISFLNRYFVYKKIRNVNTSKVTIDNIDNIDNIDINPITKKIGPITKIGETQKIKKPKTEKPKTEKPKTEKPKTEKPKTEKLKVKKLSQKILLEQDTEEFIEKEPTLIEKDPTLIEKEPTLIKKSTLIEKEPTLIKKSTLIEKEPTLIKKSTLIEKEPTLIEKDPTLIEKEPTLIKKSMLIKKSKLIEKEPTQLLIPKKKTSSPQTKKSPTIKKTATTKTKKIKKLLIEDEEN
jgi:hypothetical protein